MKNTLNVVLLVKKVVLMCRNFAHINVFQDVFVKKALYVKPMIEANVFHVPNVPVVPMNFSTTVGQHVRIHVKSDLNHALDNVYLVVTVTMVLFV
jgi:hypothetical protein